MDIVSLYKDFQRFSLEEKLEIKRNGRPTPQLEIVCNSTSRGKSYIRKFNSNIYEKYSWLCGCKIKNRVFCFPCILFGGDLHWTVNGMCDLVHLNTKANIHSNSKQHIRNDMRFALLGQTNIEAQLDTAYWKNVARHNENVAKNRFVLSKIIDVKYFAEHLNLHLEGMMRLLTQKIPEFFRDLSAIRLS